VIEPFPVFSGRWDHVFVRQVADPMRFGALVDRNLAAIAAEQGVEPVDVLLDTAVAEDFATQFSTLMRNTDDDEIGRMLTHPAARIGASDAGAHVLSNTDSAYAIWTLQHWWRERGALTLERAVRMLTADQADLLGLHDRGRIAEGLAADLVLFDPDRVARTGVRYVDDQPAGGRRLVSDVVGVEASIVNGVVATRAGRSTGARPGRFLRAR
jgi:N-acyl-D-amino-acid deacylase